MIFVSHNATLASIVGVIGGMVVLSCDAKCGLGRKSRLVFLDGDFGESQ